MDFFVCKCSCTVILTSVGCIFHTLQIVVKLNTVISDALFWMLIYFCKLHDATKAGILMLYINVHFYSNSTLRYQDVILSYNLLLGENACVGGLRLMPPTP